MKDAVGLQEYVLLYINSMYSLKCRLSGDIFQKLIFSKS